jgi:hypothetical protein
MKIFIENKIKEIMIEIYEYEIALKIAVKIGIEKPSDGYNSSMQKTLTQDINVTPSSSLYSRGYKVLEEEISSLIKNCLNLKKIHLNTILLLIGLQKVNIQY